MPLRTVTVVAIGLLAAATLRSQSPGGGPAAAPSPALITGHVMDAETQAPVPATVITLTPNGKPEYSSGSRVITDAQGRFFFNDVAPGSYTLTAAKPGWLTGAFAQHRPAGSGAPIDLHDGERVNDVTLEMWRTAVISGRVTDEQGEPLVGADVRVFQRSYAAGRAQWTFVTRALTDDRGVYRLSSLQPGDYLVVVPATVTSEPVAMGVQGQTPAAYARTMTGIGAAPMLFRRAMIATAGADTAVASILPPLHAPPAAGAWRTYATTFFPSATTTGGATVVQAISGRERSGVDIIVRMVATWQVSGTVSASDGSSTGFHAVHLLSAESADRPVVDAGTAVTDAAGRFTFYGIPPGQYVARVVRIPVGAGMTAGICGGTGEISSICVFSEGPGRPSMAVPPEPLMYADAPVTVANRDVRDIPLALKPGAHLTGHAEFEGSGARLTDAEWNALHVVLEPADGRSFVQQGGFDIMMPGVFSNDGRFTTSSVLPGRYLLRVTGAPARWAFKGATAQGRDIADTPLDLANDLSDVIITFGDRALTISGGVQGADNRPDAAAVVLLFPAAPADWVDYGRTSRRVRSVTAAGGHFSLPAPPPGEYRLVAIPDEQAADWQNPALLARAAAVADRITVHDGESITHDLRARSLP